MKGIKILSILVMLTILTVISNANAEIPSTNISSQEYKIKEANIKLLFQPIDEDAHKFVDGKKSYKDIDAFSANLVKKHSKNLDTIVEELQTMSGKSLKDKDSMEKFKQLIVVERLSRINQELESASFNKNSNVTSKSTTVFTEISEDKTTDTITYSANLPVNTNFPINSWSQVSPDIFGGKGYDLKGNYYNINGHNNLYQIDVKNGYYFSVVFGHLATHTYTEYTLHFYDEDHPDPTIDALYDFYRQLPSPIGLGTIQDIESFRIVDGYIYFNGIWDNNRAFAEFIGQHGSVALNYYSYPKKVYVSNVWNHAMDVVDKNINIGKVVLTYN